MDLGDLVGINQFGFLYKKMVLEDDILKIDKGIRDLVDVINSIDMFCTVNSCQGPLIRSERDEHCSLVYVDFYVLYHQYHLAHQLFKLLTHEFGSEVHCQVFYEGDVDYVDDDCVEQNGLINMRFRIQLIGADCVAGIEDEYKDIIKTIKSFQSSLEPNIIRDRKK